MADITVLFDIGECFTEVECEVTGSLIPADFHHDIEDNREVMVKDVLLFDSGGSEIPVDGEVMDKVCEHVNANWVAVYKAAEKDLGEVFLPNI